MKAYGFINFIKTEEIQEHRLKNCPLVVDAHSFFYRTYEQSRLPFVFGSEANEHARFIVGRKLNRFKKSDVKCYFIFKGGDTDIEWKIQGHHSPTFDFDSNYRFIAPVFLREIFLMTLEENGINYTTSITEPIDDCVALAQQIKCPILGYVSEYCFMKAPFVSNIKKYDNTDNCLIGCCYELKNFMEKYSLSYKKVAIFATLIDEYVFSSDNFNAFLQKWDIFDDEDSVGASYETQIPKYQNLLKWLSARSEDETLNQVTDFLQSETEIAKFDKRIEQVLANLQKDHRSVATEYLLNDCKLSISCRDPLWFEKGVAAQHIAIPYINLYKHKYIQGSCAIEKRKPTDSLMLSIDIIKYALNLLTNFETNQIRVFQDSENYISISTEDSNVRKPMYRCQESVFEDGWEYISRLQLFEHFLVENDINIDMINRFPVDAGVLIITLTYFAHKKISENIDVTKEVYCFIVCYVMLHAVLHTNDHYREKYRGITKRDAEEARSATQKYFQCDELEARQIFDADALKTLVELQYCLLHMNYLNTLCGKPFKPTKYHRTFNGTFIYKLLHDIRYCNASDFIEKLFQNAPSVIKYINMLVNNYKQQFW